MYRRFMLLETLYGNFDIIAKKYGIFKVETSKCMIMEGLMFELVAFDRSYPLSFIHLPVGDCYGTCMPKKRCQH